MISEREFKDLMNRVERLENKEKSGLTIYYGNGYDCPEEYQVGHIIRLILDYLDLTIKRTFPIPEQITLEKKIK